MAKLDLGGPGGLVSLPGPLVQFSPDPDHLCRNLNSTIFQPHDLGQLT